VVDIICIGEPLLEFNERRGERGLFLQGFGGDTSNAAVAAARQGARVGYVTGLGEDAFGEAFLKLWGDEGVDAAHVWRDPVAPTGIYFVGHGPTGHVFTYYRAGSAAARMTPDRMPVAAIARARVLHVSGISLAISDSACDAVLHAIALARKAGVAVSFDTNLRTRLWPIGRARSVIHGAAAQADILLPSLDDSTALTGLEDADRVAEHYLAMGPKVVALKMGSAGCLVATAGRRERIGAHKVESVDATGAGDAFDGAFLARTVAGDDPFAAALYANAAAALSTTGYGAVAPIPRPADIAKLLGR
jgi:2-dehydro-3-deoxygluconokinase